MNNKPFLRALGILAILVLAFVLTTSIFFDNTPLSIEAEPTGPQVIAQNPIEGQRLDLSSAIEITFDRDMDKAQDRRIILASFGGESCSRPIDMA